MTTLKRSDCSIVTLYGWLQQANFHNKLRIIMGIIIWLLIGAVAGWLAGNIMKGGGFGVVGNIVVGIVGSVIGGFVFGLLGFGSTSMLGSLITAVVGAVILLYIVSIVKK
ncbi:GlsB/YeaQ/YmgE family stress response membrane protein [Agarivorans albus]|uniref:GlsB/YeaQ/YmgE family stress response membrane protein n=1 Tax=Agarivorans albus TaxID=182262 RepID=UPI001FE5E0BE|nr:GlsB/YeaQ/YmgE family stress response membrane protein [Agarivorans albus]